MPQYHITHLVSLFQTVYPEISITINENDPYILPDYLQNGSCELIFTREAKTTFMENALENENIVRIPLINDQLAIVLPKNHPLADSDSITLQQLENERFCMIKEGTLMYDIAKGSCINAGIFPNIIFTSHHIEAILDLISTQNCVALLMEQQLIMPPTGPDHIDPPWKCIPITPTVNTCISLCHKSDTPLSESAKLFIDFCKKYFDEHQ